MTKRWKDEDGILWAENDWFIAAYFPTNNIAKLGRLGVEGRDDIYVEYISVEVAKQWDE